MQQLADAWRNARQLALRGHPSAVRFRRFLRTLPLTPDAGIDGEVELGPEDFLICGAPRTGTTLVTAMLHQPPAIVTVTEPWDGLRLAPRALARSLRDEVERTGALTRGVLDLAAARDGQVRRVAEGDAGGPVAVEPGWQLGVKWPTYVQLLDRMPSTRFVICLRHPYDAIASFKAVGGSVSRGLDYDTPFNRRLNHDVTEAARWSPARRRIELFARVHELLLPHLHAPNRTVVRYERWFDDHDRQWQELTDFLGAPLRPSAIQLRQESKRHLLGPRERRLIGVRCGPIADALGYRLD